MPAPKKTPPAITTRNCSFTNAVDEHTRAAVEALAEAAKANADAVNAIARALGPADGPILQVTYPPNPNT